MDQSKVLNDVATLNAELMKFPWLDVEVSACSPYSVVLDGGTDLSVGPDIRIRFEAVYYVSLVMNWRTDTSRTVLCLISGPEAFAINTQYQVEQRHHIFAFQPEYLSDSTRCLVIAKSLSWDLAAK